MTDRPKRPILPKLDDLIAVSARLQTARANDPAMRQSDADEVLRLKPDNRAVLRGKFNGQDAVFRVYLDSDDPVPHREWSELNRVWTYMNTGHYQVSEPLYHSVSHGIFVQRYAHGKTLQKVWQRRKSSDPVQYLAPAAQWLRRYTQPTEVWRPAGFTGWLEKARRGAERQSFAVLSRLEAQILMELERLAEIHNEEKWRVATCHGDFHPGNLIVNKDKLTGIDTGESSRMGIYKDMARFLVHMARRGLNPSAQLWLGVDRQGIKAFADAFELSQAERSIYLPFMIGCEALIRPEQPEISQSRVEIARNMSAAMLDDLRKTGSR